MCFVILPASLGALPFPFPLYWLSVSRRPIFVGELRVSRLAPTVGFFDRIRTGLSPV